jgi:ubiquinone/menaquinone biosynthesis C-methylase UbiE
MTTEAKVADHYTKPRLAETILQAVRASVPGKEQLAAEDLAPVDEFHVGGLEATKELAARMEIRPGLHLLDVGCGIGGPARYMAEAHGCRVTGIDLTAEFVETAKELTRIVKLDHLAEFQQASALALPFEAGAFDGAYLIHVGMNIADKAGVFREVRRVLKPGGRFTIFDILRSGDGAMRFPVPWAVEAETSFVAGAADYRDGLERAGFRLASERSWKAFAIDFIQKTRARMAQSGPPALGMHLLLGDKTGPMLANVLAMLQEGVLDPTELSAQAQ